MKKTCYNCENFCNTLFDRENPNYHLHDWCKHWRTFIPTYGIADQFEYNDCYHNDLETGDAYCYMFYAKEKPMFEDEWFDKNKQENIKNRKKIPVIAVQGPTASGKSATALAICEKYGGEIISCDSMQIYRGMDIGTAKPTKEEMARVPHHLIDICDPDEDFSAATFAVVAQNAIANVYARGKVPVLCGGTGLYLDSVLRGVDFGELDPNPEYRAELAKFAEENGNAALHAKLREIDHDAAAAIHPNNVKRVIRALEICKTSGMTKTEWDKKAIQNESPYEAVIFALDYRDRETLYSRIDRRVDEMMAEGLVAEVQSLLTDGYLTPESTAGGAIGYKELIGYCRGEMPLEDAAAAVKLATRHYAKRQLTWLRRNAAIQWLYPDDYESQDELFAAAFAMIEEKYPR